MGVDESVAAGMDFTKILFMIASVVVLIGAVSSFLFRSPAILNLGIFVGKYAGCATISGLHPESWISLDSINKMYAIYTPDGGITGMVSPGKEPGTFRFGWAVYPGQIEAQFEGRGFERFIFTNKGGERDITQEEIR